MTHKRVRFLGECDYLTTGKIYDIQDTSPKSLTVTITDDTGNAIFVLCDNIGIKDGKWVWADYFEKSELKTGMLVETEGEHYWLVLKDTGCACEHNDGIVEIGDCDTDMFVQLKMFTDTLESSNRECVGNIVRVVAPINYPDVVHPECDFEFGNILYDRNKIENRKKMTIEEIEDILGYKIAVVDEEEK